MGKKKNPNWVDEFEDKITSNDENINQDNDKYFEFLIEFFNDTSKNLDVKSDISNPKSWSAFKIFQQYLESKGLISSANMLEQFRIKYFTYSISDKRLSRKEVTDIMKNQSFMLQKEEKPNIDVNELRL